MITLGAYLLDVVKTLVTATYLVVVNHVSRSSRIFHLARTRRMDLLNPTFERRGQPHLQPQLLFLSSEYLQSVGESEGLEGALIWQVHVLRSHLSCLHLSMTVLQYNRDVFVG